MGQPGAGDGGQANRPPDAVDGERSRAVACILAPRISGSEDLPNDAEALASRLIGAE